MPWDVETELGATDLVGSFGPCAGRDDAIARLRAAWSVPGSVTVVLGSPGIGKRTAVSRAQMDDIIDNKGNAWGMGAWLIDGRKHSLADAVLKRAEKWGLSGSLSVANAAAWIEEHLSERDGMLIVSDVDAKDVLAGRVPLPRGSMRLVLLSCDPALPGTLRRGGHADAGLIELGPFEPGDDLEVLEAMRDERYDIAPQFALLWPQFCAALGRHPWALHLLVRVICDDEAGGHVAPGPLLARLRAAGSEADALGFPKSSEALARYAIEQCESDVQARLADWAAAGWPGERPAERGWGDDPHLDEMLEAWGLLLPAGQSLALAPPVLRVGRSLPDYRSLQARAAALAAEYVCERARRPPSLWFESDGDRLPAVVTGMADVGEHGAAARLLAIAARRMAAWNQHHVVADGLSRLLPVLTDPFEVGVARAALGWMELDLDRPDLALGHLRLASAAFAEVPEQTTAPAAWFAADMQPDARVVEVRRPPAMEREPVDFVDSFFSQDTTPQAIEESDARLHHALDDFEKDVLVEDRRALVAVDLARARVGLGQGEAAWRDLAAWHDWILAIGRYDVRAEALQQVGEVALQAGDMTAAADAWRTAADSWQCALAPGAAAECWKLLADILPAERPALQRSARALLTLEQTLPPHYRSSREVSALIDLALAAGQRDAVSVRAATDRAMETLFQPGPDDVKRIADLVGRVVASAAVDDPWTNSVKL